MKKYYIRKEALAKADSVFLPFQDQVSKNYLQDRSLEAAGRIQRRAGSKQPETPSIKEGGQDHRPVKE